MTVIELPDDQAAALKARAAAQGLTLEGWFEKLSGVRSHPTRRPSLRKSRYSLAELMAQCDAERSSVRRKTARGWMRQPSAARLEFSGAWRRLSRRSKSDSGPRTGGRALRGDRLSKTFQCTRHAPCVSDYARRQLRPPCRVRRLFERRRNSDPRRGSVQSAAGSRSTGAPSAVHREGAGFHPGRGFGEDPSLLE